MPIPEEAQRRGQCPEDSISQEGFYLFISEAGFTEKETFSVQQIHSIMDLQWVVTELYIDAAFRDSSLTKSLKLSLLPSALHIKFGGCPPQGKFTQAGISECVTEE